MMGEERQEMAAVLIAAFKLTGPALAVHPHVLGTMFVGMEM